jgi:hypothetical protein
MRVKILSGNAAGSIQDVPQVEADVLIATGFGELVTDEPTPDAIRPVTAMPDPDGDAEPNRRHPRRRAKPATE